jgi:branched-chain amino acid transport system ATP-binding protein
MSLHALELNAVFAGYGAIRILHGISMDVAAGSVTALIGANGAGKTTLMRTIAGLLPVQSGTVRFAGADIGREPPSSRVERGLVLVPEGRLLFPTLSVEENLRLGAINPRARAQATARMNTMFELFPRLFERRRQAAGSLSGGEQQMVAIARGLMAEPSMVLMDEPTLGLAPLVVELIFQTIESLRLRGLTVLLAEQDMRRALEIADTAYVVENGTIAASGSSGAILADPRIRSAFLGL